VPFEWGRFSILDLKFSLVAVSSYILSGPAKAVRLSQNRAIIAILLAAVHICTLIFAVLPEVVEV